MARRTSTCSGPRRGMPARPTIRPSSPSCWPTCVLKGVWPFAYPPTFLLVAWPFAQLPLSVAYPLWAALESALFVLAASHLVKPVWATAALAIAPVVFFSAELGQTSLLVGAAAIGGWVMRDKRPALAGVLFGLAACIKPQAMLLAPIVLWGRWRVLAYMAATGAALVLASLGFGWRRWLEWPQALAAFKALVPMTDRINPSALVTAPAWPALAWSMLIGAAGVALAAQSRRLSSASSPAALPDALRPRLRPGATGAAGPGLAGRAEGLRLGPRGRRRRALGRPGRHPAAALGLVAALAIFHPRWRLALAARRDRRRPGRAGRSRAVTLPSDRIIRVGLALLAFAVWSVFAAVHAHVKPADYYVFWEAARHWQAPYDPALITALEARLHITGAWPFAYPPTFLLLAWPFAQLPLALAYPLWTGVSAALFIYAAAHLVKPPWATVALFIAPPVLLAISPGQTSLIVGAAMIGGWLWREDRPRLAGLAFAVAACIKPQAMILAPVVLWGHWRLVRWALIAGAGLVLASFAFGPGLWLQGPHARADSSHVAPATDRVNPSALAASLAAGRRAGARGALHRLDRAT